MTLTTSQKKRLEAADKIVQAKEKPITVQPRFEPGASRTIYNLTAKWAKEILEHAPPYYSDSRQRSTWLTQFWPNEPFLAGVINSVTQIDRNRGWSLVGGRNQVARLSQVLHNYHVSPGQSGWRSGVGAAALSFYTTDIGALIEVGRQFAGGPMAGLFHLDPTRCLLTGIPETPVIYRPTMSGKLGVNSISFAPQDTLRTNSMTNVDETFNGLGYCALSRAMELAITMTAVWRHEQEMLFARAPKGLLLLKGITQGQWDTSMKANSADLEAMEREWFGNVAVFASGGDLDIDAKIFMLSNLPAGFDQEKFTNLLMYGYALCFGYDAREFWPVSGGALGTATETVTQHRKSTDKGGREFWFGLQEQIQQNLPPTIHFEADERSAEGELEDAQLQLAKIQAINAMYETGAQRSTGEGLISYEEARELYAEGNLIPRDWTTAVEDEELTDTDQARQRCLEYPEVQQAIDKFPDEPIVQYHWPQGRIQVLYATGTDALKTFVDMGRGVARSKQTRFGDPIAERMQKLAAEVEQGGEGSGNYGYAGRPGEVGGSDSGGGGSDSGGGRSDSGGGGSDSGGGRSQTASAKIDSPASWLRRELQALKDLLSKKQSDPVNVTINNQQAATPITLESHTHVEPTPITVENKNIVNVPKQAAQVVNVQDNQAQERKEFMDKVRKLK